MVNLLLELDEQLQEELRHIDKNIVNKATTKALRDIAKPVLKTIKDTVPTDTHLLQKKMSLSASKGKGVAVVYAGLSKKNHPGWLITRGLAMEYGNERVSGEHYLARSAKRYRQPVYRRFVAFMNNHIDRLL